MTEASVREPRGRLCFHGRVFDIGGRAAAEKKLMRFVVNNSPFRGRVV